MNFLENINESCYKLIGENVTTGVHGDIKNVLGK